MDVTGSKLQMVQEWFVNDDFGVTENVKDTMRFVYIDGVLYDAGYC